MKPPTVKPVWHTLTQVGCVLKAPNGRALSVLISSPHGGKFACVAIEGSDTVRTMGDLFENHSHAIVGERFPTVAKAKAAAERYMRRWLKQNQPMERCGCETISLKRGAAA